MDAAIAAVATQPTPTGAATKAAFPALLDWRRRWIFEVVAGKSLATLRPVKHAPRVFGYVSKPKARDSMEYVWLSTMAERTRNDVDYTLAPKIAFGIALDDDGIRQLAAIGDLAPVNDKSNVRGFTFPIASDVPSKLARDVMFGNITIDVTREKLRIAGASREVLVARAKNFDRRHDETWYELYAYAPDLGPALLCPDAAPGELECLRLVEIAERFCIAAATTLCTGKDASGCAAILDALLLDPKTGKPDLDPSAERRCRDALADPARLEELRATLPTP